MTAKTLGGPRNRHSIKISALGIPDLAWRAGVLAASLGLSACGLVTGEPADPKDPADPAPSLVVVAAVPNAPPPAKPAAAPKRLKEQRPEKVAAPPETRPPPEPEREYPDPGHLSGLDRTQVMALLGTPRFKRRDDPAEVWRYRTPACALDLFLYRPAGGGAYRVDHFETRGRGEEKVSGKDCFHSLIKAHEKRPAG